MTAVAQAGQQPLGLGRHLGQLLPGGGHHPERIFALTADGETFQSGHRPHREGHALPGALNRQLDREKHAPSRGSVSQANSAAPPCNTTRSPCFNIPSCKVQASMIQSP